MTRANFNSGRDTPQNYRVLRPGLLEGRQSADGQSRASATSRRSWPDELIKDFTLKNNWAPRSAPPIDLTGDGKTKLFGNYGRFYARVPNDLAARALSADDGISRADYFDAGLTRPIPNGTATRSPTGSAGHQPLRAGRRRLPTRSTRTPSSLTLDEFGVGFEREIVPNTTRRRPLHPPQHRPRARRRRECADRRLRSRRPVAVGGVEYILTNPTSAHADLPGGRSSSARSSTIRCTIPRGRGHAQPPVLEQLVG